MRVLYIASMFDEETYNRLFTKEEKPMHAASKYHTLLCEGIAENGIPINTYSVLPVSRANCASCFVHVPALSKGNLKREYISSWNLPILRHLGLFISGFFKALLSPRDTILAYDALVISASIGAALGAKLRHMCALCIVTDLPQYQPVSNMGGVFLRINNALLSMADAYVFLTKQMNDVINLKHKPYIVLEGHADSAMQNKAHYNTTEKKIVLYAGSLKTIYGIKNLCEAFAECAEAGEELHVYGDGDYVPELLKLTGTHINIVFHGNRMNTEVVEAELKATLLVNPRPTEGEYTKYSFPSKTLEYMASGTPVLSARLEGIPEEYDEYLYYFDDKEPDGLKNALRTLLDKPRHELDEKGKTAREFVLGYKTNLIQAKKVIAFLKTMKGNGK